MPLTFKMATGLHLEYLNFLKHLRSAAYLAIFSVTKLNKKNISGIHDLRKIGMLLRIVHNQSIIATS